MRKEAKILLAAILIGLIILVNVHNVFNLIISFFLTGLIPGTQIAIPSVVMFILASIALSTLIVQPIRKYLPRKYIVKSVRGRFLQIEV